MKKLNWRELKIEAHNIIYAEASEPDYEMGRKILLTYTYDKYIVLEGWHCSCYDFNETEWEAIEYDAKEIVVLANASYNKDNSFWKQVLIHVRAYG